jgi:enoyl-CoA hydratase/carnithine racemase
VSDYELVHAYDTVNLYQRGPAAKIELNRPDRLNAWNEQFAADLLAALTTARDDPGVRAVMITGAGVLQRRRPA